MTLDEQLRGVLREEAERREHQAPDPFAIMHRAQARRQRRRTAWGAAAVAAVLAAGFGITGLVGGQLGAPSPAAPPPVITAPPLPDADCAGGGCLPPGTYAIGLSVQLGPEPAAEVTVAATGWMAHQDVRRISRAGPEGLVSLAVYAPLALASPANPCGAPEPLPARASTVEVTERLAGLPQFRVVEPPGTVEAFGREVTRLRLEADALTCVAGAGDQYNLADHVDHDDSDIDTGRPVALTLWVLDLAGIPIVVEERQEGAPTGELVAELEQVRSTLRLGISDETSG